MKIFLQHLIVLMSTCCTCRIVWKKGKQFLGRNCNFISHSHPSNEQSTTRDFLVKICSTQGHWWTELCQSMNSTESKIHFECLFTAKFCRNNWKMFWENCFLFYWIFPINFILSVPPISFSILFVRRLVLNNSLSFSSDKFTFTCIFLFGLLFLSRSSKIVWKFNFYGRRLSI